MDVGQRRAVARIARLVLDLEALMRSRSLATSDTFDLPLRQEDIADALGLTTAHVNRTMAQLRSSKTLEITGGMATIMDREELERIAANG
ncbi:MAG: helix-turn-helix domain-containing protein [Hyphomonadaceae bacterium]|nr:helix-turn-helix domain-containing protein [Hyphomonadaceae bacterium]